MNTYVSPSGAQHEIRSGRWRATITEVGATLRELTFSGIPVLDGFGVGEMASGGRGQVLAPWPNRIRDGRYTFDGTGQQLPLSEPPRLNASHGLVRWVAWSVVAVGADRLRLEYSLRAQPGYPFSLQFRIEYSVSAEGGLECAFAAENVGAGAAPFGVGFHPYVMAGGGDVDGWKLAIPAAERLLTDARMLPVGREDVLGGAFDFSAGRQIGPSRLDTCFLRLFRGSDGMAVVRVEGERTVEVWLGEGLDYVMVFTGDSLPEGARRGLAVEPMSCAPDAFNSGEGLRVLDPGDRFEVRWGLRTSSTGACN